METWNINLWNTKNYMLLGDIGEAIALHYLSSHGFFIVTRPVKFLHGKLSLISAHYQIKPPKINRSHWLTDKQKEYLENFQAWDYVAFKRECEPYQPNREEKKCLRVWRTPYLVEVKTVKGKENPHKKPKSNAVYEAKALGFKPILITVRLLENWNASVQASEL